MAIKIKVTQLKSGIGCPERQRATLRGLGLGKVHKSAILEDSVAIRGMIRKVSHLIAIEPAE
jgi:large subunit ribosomal protein L30